MKAVSIQLFEIHHEAEQKSTIAKKIDGIYAFYWNVICLLNRFGISNLYSVSEANLSWSENNVETLVVNLQRGHLVLLQLGLSAVVNVSDASMTVSSNFAVYADFLKEKKDSSKASSSWEEFTQSTFMSYFNQSQEISPQQVVQSALQRYHQSIMVSHSVASLTSFVTVLVELMVVLFGCF